MNLISGLYLQYLNYSTWITCETSPCLYVSTSPNCQGHLELDLSFLNQVLLTDLIWMYFIPLFESLSVIVQALGEIFVGYKFLLPDSMIHLCSLTFCEYGRCSNLSRFSLLVSFHSFLWAHYYLRKLVYPRYFALNQGHPAHSSLPLIMHRPHLMDTAVIKPRPTGPWQSA